MIVLDTNVVSELTRPAPDPRVVTWVDELDPAEVAVTAMTAAELLAGIAVMAVGKRRDQLGARVATLLSEVFAGRILPFTPVAAVAYAEVVAGRRREGAPIGTADAIIAATCLAHRVEALATRNTVDFAGTGVRVRNPWDRRTA